MVDGGKLRDFSLLALFETFVASLLAIFIAWRTGFVWQIVASSFIAPILLLRSKESTRSVVKITDNVLSKMFDEQSIEKGTFYKMIEVIIVMSTIVPMMAVSKFFVASFYYITHPLHSLRHIPENFYHNVFILDMYKSPQIIPDAEVISIVESSEEYYSLYGVYKDAARGYRNTIEEFSDKSIGLYYKLFMSIMWVIYIVAFLIPMTFICFSFRYCIKSTALVWLPLLWILYQAHPGKNTSVKMRIAIGQPWFKVVMVYSVFVFFAFIIKIFLFVNATDILLPEHLGPIQKIGDSLLDPLNIPLWQIAGFMNAVLALLFYNEAKKHTIAEGSTEAWASGWIKAEYSVIQTVRTVLSLYTISCFLYILIATGANKEWPAVRFILFPW